MDSIVCCIECPVVLTDKTGYKRKGKGFLPRCRTCHGYYVKDRYNAVCRGDLSAKEYGALLDNDGGRCHCCGAQDSRNALMFNGYYHIYCVACSVFVSGGKRALDKLLKYMGGDADSVW